jgi:hypothetical protein
MAEANIPRFRAERAAVPGTYDPLRRPGSSGQRYFSDMQYANPNMAPRVFEDDKAGYETQAAYDTRFNNSMDAAVNAARATNTAQANQFGLANLANPARGTRPSAQTLSDAEVRQTFADIYDNPAYDTDRRVIEQGIGAMNQYNISPQRASELMNVPLADIRAMMSPYYTTLGEANSEGITNLLGQEGLYENANNATQVQESQELNLANSPNIWGEASAMDTSSETTAENQQALGSQALYEALMENAYNIGNETTGTYGYSDTTGGTTNSESWNNLISDTQAQSISADVRNILNTGKNPYEIANQITRLLSGEHAPKGIPSVAVDGVVRRAAGVPDGQNLTDFFNGFETRPTLRRFYTEAGIVPSFASTVDRRGGYSEQDIANAAFYLNSGYLTADQVAQVMRQNRQGVEGLDVTGEDVSQNLVDYNARTDLNLLGQNVVPAEQYDFSAFGIPGVTTTTYTDELTNEQAAADTDTVTDTVTDDTTTGTTADAGAADTTTDLDAITEIIKGKSQTPAQAASTAGISEENLIVQLLRAGKTNFDEVAKYYQDQYPGITAAQVEANFTNSSYAQGGIASVAPQRQGYYLGGATDGMADQIPATIDNRQPAALSDGEFVIPADVVSHLGNGNSSAGATQLHGMMDKVRQARTGSTEQGRQINPNKFLA